MIEFIAWGVPVPQGSKTIAHSGSGRAFVRDDNPRLEPWRSTITARAVEAMNGREPFAGPVALVVEYQFPRPRSHYRTGKLAGELKASAPSYCATRPDLDKLLRALGDAIAGVVVRDDAQVVSVWARKCYGSPGMRVEVHPL